MIYINFSHIFFQNNVVENRLPYFQESPHNKRSLQEKGDFTLFTQSNITAICGVALIHNGG